MKTFKIENTHLKLDDKVITTISRKVNRDIELENNMRRNYNRVHISKKAYKRRDKFLKKFC